MNIDAIWVLKKEMDVLRKDKEILIKENILLKEQLHNFVFTKTLANGELIQIDSDDNITKTLTDGETIQIDNDNNITKTLTNKEIIKIDSGNIIYKYLISDDIDSDDDISDDDISDDIDSKNKMTGTQIIIDNNNNISKTYRYYEYNYRNSHTHLNVFPSNEYINGNKIIIQIDNYNTIIKTLPDGELIHIYNEFDDNQIRNTLKNGELIDIYRESITKLCTNGEQIVIDYDNTIFKTSPNNERTDIYIDKKRVLTIL